MLEGARLLLAQRFIELTQGESSVAEYVTSFESLSKFGTEHINTLVKKNQRFVHGLNKTLKRSLLLKLEVPFDQLVDLALRLEETDRVNDGNVGSIKKKKQLDDEPQSSRPTKKGKQATAVANTPTRGRGECHNFGAVGHYANDCRRPLFCRYCKDSGHHVYSCPILQKRKNES